MENVFLSFLAESKHTNTVTLSYFSSCFRVMHRNRAVRKRIVNDAKAFSLFSTLLFSSKICFRMKNNELIIAFGLVSLNCPRKVREVHLIPTIISFEKETN